MESIQLKNVYVYPFTQRDEMLCYIEGKSKILVAINAEKILKNNKNLEKIINENIGYADGIGAVFALKKKGYKKAIKIPGCELWLDIINKYYKTKSFYLVGSTEKVITDSVTKLKELYPGIAICGFRNGYIKSDQEKMLLINDIVLKKPDFVFVAMGSPKQEFLMNEMLSHHPAIYQGLGGSFDVFTNNVVRAPRWWIDNNLEWAYRLVKQPSRILRQSKLLKFLLLLVFGRI